MSRGKVLVADDSPLAAGMTAEALRQAGFEVELASDGYEAIERCYSIVPDVVVMDIDMPLLKGYQASRLLASRRGVRDIPVVMHTANTEDKDRFWAYDSGARAFVTKDWDNLGPLVERVAELADHPRPDERAIAEDARTLTRATIAEAVADMLDGELFRGSIVNRLAEAGRSMSSLSGTAMRVLELLDLACERQVAVLLLRNGREVMPWVYPTEAVNREMADDLVSVALADHFSRFDRNQSTIGETYYFNVEERTDWNKVRLENASLSSCFRVELRGTGDEVIGSIHLAHLRNNYFSPAIVANLEAFARAAGPILHNAALFRRVAAMERDIRGVFAKFVPPEVIDELVTRRSSARMLAGEKRELAILFSDIRNFTALSETNPPEAVVSFLNRYLETMCEIVTERGGVVDKYIGDAILAVFGAPQSWPDNAARAVDAALAMCRALRSFDVSGVELPSGGFDIGIGVHLGDAIVGTMGSSTKFDYTVIGDTVNLASRLEGLTKVYGTRVIVSARVVEAVGAERRDSFREIERVVVKGKEEPTLVYALEEGAAGRDRADDSGGGNEAGGAGGDFGNLYKKALAMYKLRNWNTAADLFSRALLARPSDPLSSMFLGRCRDFAANPPPEDWDLVQRYVTK